MTIDLSRKRVAVTGGRGFLGFYVMEKLKARGVREIFAPSHKEIELIDPDAVRMFYEVGKPDIVIHLAARAGGIGANQANPGSFIYENMAMGLNLIECARHFGVEKFVLIGTTCSYPKFAPLPFKEEDLWNGYPEEVTAPYGVAKRALMVMGQAYQAQYGMCVITLLPTNLFGPGDSLDLSRAHVIPALVLKCLQAMKSGSDELVVWGSGTATRDFLYVEDAAEGIVLATEQYDDSYPVNLGSGVEVSIKQVSELIAKLAGFKGRNVWDTSRPDGIPRRALDVSRAEREFGFRASTSLDIALSRTIEWYKKKLHTKERMGV